MGLKIFLAETAKNFRTTGALVPSSQALASELTADLANPSRKPLRILEVGPGTGSVTRMIAKRMIPGDRLDIVEINPAFAAAVRNLMSRAPEFQAVRPQIHLIEADLLTLQKCGVYDVIICGLPFNNFKPDVVLQFFEILDSLLASDGLLSYFEYWIVRHVKEIFASLECRDKILNIKDLKFKLHQDARVRSKIVWANLPPAVVYHIRVGQRKGD